MKKITVSAPCKVHLLGEWAVVWGKPALLTTVDLRVNATISENSNPSFNSLSQKLKKVIEPIVKKYLKIQKFPSYQIEINSEAPIGSHLGTSAASSAVYIASLLSFLKEKWDLELINELTYEAEKVFHGNPSGADNSTVVYGGIVWYRKENNDLKIIHPLTFSIPKKLSKNFLLINTGPPKMNTRQMIDKITALFDKNAKLKEVFLKNQEQLVRELLPALKNADEKAIIRIIREGERNLESIGVCSKEVKKIIRSIENVGGAAKICGAGALEGPTGVLLVFHKNRSEIEKIAKGYNLPCFTTNLGVSGLKQE